MRRLRGIIAIGVFALMIAYCIEVSRLNHTCVICRLYRVATTCLGLTRSSYTETECSRWYAAHVEPTHAHIWGRGTCCYESNLLGLPMRVGCSPGRYPIMLLNPSTQMQVYQHFENPLEAKRLFANLTDAKSHNDRLDEHDEDRGHLTVEAIEAWKTAGFPGSWDEWWARYHAKHVEEHKERLTWLHSDSGLSFTDWRKQRAPSD